MWVVTLIRLYRLLFIWYLLIRIKRWLLQAIVFKFTWCFYNDNFSARAFQKLSESFQLFGASNGRVNGRLDKLIPVITGINVNVDVDLDDAGVVASGDAQSRVERLELFESTFERLSFDVGRVDVDGDVDDDRRFDSKHRCEFVNLRRRKVVVVILGVVVRKVDTPQEFLDDFGLIIRNYETAALI